MKITKRLYDVVLLEHFPNLVELAMDTDFNCFTPDLKRTLRKHKTDENNSKWYVNVGCKGIIYRVYESYLTPLLG
jgi:hypothetical protein